MRIAHFSDIHVTASPIQQGLKTLWGKRAGGAVNYYIGGRRHHFADVDHRIRRLLDDVDAQNVDHAVCTGDITQMSYEDEFDRCAALFGPRLSQPDRYTVIPGNHDRYTTAAVQAGWFEKHFGAVCDDGQGYPFRKDVGSVSFVGLDLARPCGIVDSSGYCGPTQLAALQRHLTALTAEGRRTIVLLHYGFYRADGRPDRQRHGIRDADALMAVLDDEAVRVDLILHGHMHSSYTVRTQRRTVICAGSATDLAHKGGYNVYELGEDSVAVRRRIWSAGSYVDEKTVRVAL